MLIIKTKNYRELSKRACWLVIDEINRKPNLVVCFATGETPLGLYSELIKAYRKKQVSFSKVKSFNLDEYYPISKKDKRSFYYYMHKNIFNEINIKKNNINLLNGEAKDWKKECRDYERKIQKQKIDLMILGVGVNGHIAFNEPGSGFNSKTRWVEIADKKIKKKGLTMGIKTIMNARKIILLASGKSKALAIEKLLNGCFDKEWPVSVLNKHKNLIVIVDKEAGSLIK